MQLAHGPTKESPNLAKPVSTERQARLLQTILKTNKTLLFLTEVVLLSFIIYNLKLGNDIKKADEELAGVTAELDSIRQREDDLRKLKAKLDHLDRLKSENPKVQNKIALIYKTTPQEVSINKLTLSQNTIALDLSTQKGEYFAKMLTSYLSTKDVEQVILTSANYITYVDSYDFSVEVVVRADL